MNGTQPQPSSEKLSDTIGIIIQQLDNTEALTGEQVCTLVGLLRAHLPNLRTFAADFELALAHPMDRMVTCYAAAAATRLYRRMTAPSAPILAVRSPIAQLIELDRFRRPPAGGAA